MGVSNAEVDSNYTAEQRGGEGGGDYVHTQLHSVHGRVLGYLMMMMMMMMKDARQGQWQPRHSSLGHLMQKYETPANTTVPGYFMRF